MKIPRSKSGSRRTGGGAAGRPRAGVARPGRTVDPKQAPDEALSDAASRASPRAAPAPGVPVSHEEYEELKRKAKTAVVPRSKHSQEDPSG